jgi:hypothetical protein
MHDRTCPAPFASTAQIISFLATPRRAVLRALAVAAAAGILVAGTGRTAAQTARQNPQALSAVIDREIQARLDAAHVPAAGPADDVEFLRRAYLDLVGVIPPPEKVVAFLNNRAPDKRARLINELLADPRFGRFQAEIWADAMVPADSNNRRLKAGPLRDWLADAFNRNQPWNKTVYAIVTAAGHQDENGAVTLFLANPTPDKMTDTISRLFLGVQLQCAQCHNHPFTSWKRKEYWGMAAFFTKVHPTANPKKAAKKGVSPGITEEGPPRRKAKLAKVGLSVSAKFLQGPEPKLRPSEPYRPVLAKWMTSPDNRFFARALANKMWAHFFGRGLVNPVDDMIDEHEPSHPKLLAALAEQFKASGFDVKFLVRAICNSRTYQRTSQTTAGKSDPVELLSHMPVRVLSPGQLYDSLTAVLGNPETQRLPKGKKAAIRRKGGFTPRDQFIAFFQVGDGASPLEYQAGIPQALRLMNAQPVNANGPALTRAIQAGGGNSAKVIEQLYLTALARRPTAEERQRLTAYVARQPNPRIGYSDILWALLNSGEFSVNH